MCYGSCTAILSSFECATMFKVHAIRTHSSHPFATYSYKFCMILSIFFNNLKKFKARIVLTVVLQALGIKKFSWIHFNFNFVSFDLCT